MKNKKKYFIKYGLSGGFGGMTNFILEDHYTEDQANRSGWNLAIEEYKNVIQNNVIEQFQTGNIDWRFYSNVINNKMSLWIGGIYLVAMPVVKAVNEKRKLNKEKMFILSLLTCERSSGEV